MSWEVGPGSLSRTRMPRLVFISAACRSSCGDRPFDYFRQSRCPLRGIIVSHTDLGNMAHGNPSGDLSPDMSKGIFQRHNCLCFFFFGPENADEQFRLFQVWRHLGVDYRSQSNTGILQVPDDVTEFAVQQFANPVDSMRRTHRSEATVPRQKRRVSAPCPRLRQAGSLWKSPGRHDPFHC